MVNKQHWTTEQFDKLILPYRSIDQRIFPALLTTMRHLPAVTGPFFEALSQGPSLPRAQALIAWSRVTESAVNERCWDFFNRNNDAFKDERSSKLANGVASQFEKIHKLGGAFPTTLNRYLNNQEYFDHDSGGIHEYGLLAANPMLDESPDVLQSWYATGGKAIPHRYLGQHFLAIEHDPTTKISLDFLRAPLPSSIPREQYDYLRFLEKLAQLSSSSEPLDALVDGIAALPSEHRSDFADLMIKSLAVGANMALAKEFLRIARRAGAQHGHLGEAARELAIKEDINLTDGLWVLTERIKREIPVDAAVVEELRSKSWRSVRESESRKHLESTRRIAEKPLDEMRRSFLQSQGEDGSPMTQEQFDRITRLYESVLARGDALLRLSDEELSSYVKQTLVTKLASLGECEESALEYLSVVREVTCRTFGIFPFSTQIYSCLAVFLNRLTPVDLAGPKKRGLALQIKTGEGKSLTIALISNYLALLGENIDIVTSNNYLAARDEIQFAPLFAAFGITSSSFIRDENTRQFPSTNVVYTTNHNLIHHLLSARIAGLHPFAHREQNVLFVDESDNLTIDKGKETVRIAESVPQRFGETDFRTMMSFVQSVNMDALLRQDSLAQTFIKTTGRCKEVRTPVLTRYLIGVARAQLLHRNVDYIVDEESGRSKVILIDQESTGRRKPRSSWQYGTYEAVTLREGLALHGSDGLSAQMTHPDFVNRYSTLICLSGTLGDKGDRNEFRKNFGVSDLDIAPHKPSQRIDKPARFFVHRRDWEQVFIDLVTSDSQRPLLLAFDTIQQSERMYELLKPHHAKIQLLNDARNISFDDPNAEEEDIIAQAGLCGVCTVTTAVAGRGTDIKPEHEALQLGGMEVVLGYYPETFRGEDQLRGRGGRQGNRGVTQMLVYTEEDHFLSQLSKKGILHASRIAEEFGGSARETRSLIDFTRRAHNLLASFYRQQNYAISASSCRIQDTYFSRRDDIANQLAALAQGSKLESEDFSSLVHRRLLPIWSNLIGDYEIELEDFVRQLEAKGNGQTVPQIKDLLELEKISLGMTIDELGRHERGNFYLFAKAIEVYYQDKIFKAYLLQQKLRNGSVHTLERLYQERLFLLLANEQAEVQRRILGRRDGN